MQYLNCFI